ncbi:MAG: BatA domain-containing protein, partial [Vicinamibacteria bacterium]
MSRFVYPWCLLALSVVPVLIYWRRRHRYREPALRFSEVSRLEGLTPSLWTRLAWLPFATRMLAVALLVVALARPQKGAAGEEIVAEGVDIMLVIDISTSMLAEDFRPNNRLHVAKEVVADFIKRRDNDRLGMIVFARHALTKTPLTLDHDILLTQLESVEIGSVPD